MVIHLVSGPIGSGKTTRLMAWCRQLNQVGGIISPVLSEKRYFLDIFSNEWRPMEAGVQEKAVQQVGRFTFSDASFGWANQVLLQAALNPALQWLVIDEIGPLELAGKGLHPALDQIFNEIIPRKQIVLVIRQKLVETVTAYYGLYRYPVLPVHLPNKQTDWQTG